MGVVMGAPVVGAGVSVWTTIVGWPPVGGVVVAVIVGPVGVAVTVDAGPVVVAVAVIVWVGVAVGRTKYAMARQF